MSVSKEQIAGLTIGQLVGILLDLDTETRIDIEASESLWQKLHEVVTAEVTAKYMSNGCVVAALTGMLINVLQDPSDESVEECIRALEKRHSPENDVN